MTSEEMGAGAIAIENIRGHVNMRPVIVYDHCMHAHMILRSKTFVGWRKSLRAQ